MPISWNEIRHNAIRFAHDWAAARREDAEAKTFWDEFFKVFGVSRRAVASFEAPVKQISGDYGFIDLFWPKVLLVEHKSRGKDLSKAESQAFRYIQDLARTGRGDEIPRYVIVSDFARIALHDLEPEEQRDLPSFDQWRVKTVELPLAEFHKHIHDFAFIPGYKQHKFEDQDPVNLKAVAMLGNLHDALEFGGYTGHELERFLVRVLFCLFAEDTGIFEREAFRLYLENRTAADGSDLGPHLARLFEVLNTPPEKRQKNLDETLAAFPYVNGALFSEHLGFADFNRDMRNALLACTRFDWAPISPAVFGSLFQAVMEPKERRQTGGHYTSERDILKVVRALFLDDLRAEFERVRGATKALENFHQKLGALRFLDPACGCGNFLVITYRELRLLELDVLKVLYRTEQALSNVDLRTLCRIDVDAFFGIEIGEWPARIAEVAMWLMDHQMNLRLAEAFGQYFVRLPLKKSPTIVCGNALRRDWKTVLPPEQCSYILGNPPFVGAKFQTADQRADMDAVAAGMANAGLLDYVTGWYFKAADYVGAALARPADVASDAPTKAPRVAFVSTNSITQGEQAGVLWPALFGRYGVKIHFGHRTFAWQSEARGKAHVHVVIIGFGRGDAANKRIYDYEADPENPTIIRVGNISPYLVEGPDRAITNRSTPLCAVPEINFGNQPIDGGHFLLRAEERDDLLAKEPQARKFLRLYLGSHEFINGEQRWCLWLQAAAPDELRAMPEVLKRIEAVRQFRLASKRPATRELATTPTQFAFVSHPEKEYLLIPSVSSERRRYIPLGFMPQNVITSNLCLLVPNATRYHFGVLSSTMHMAWVRQICGRLESRYRYSNKLVYNNYPWPAESTPAQRKAVEDAAQQVLDVRAEFMKVASGCRPDATTGRDLRRVGDAACNKQGGSATLADLYDPLTMPPALVKAHAELDRAVERCYRAQPFANDRQRVEFLFALYEKLIAPLLPATGKKRRAKSAG